MKIDILKAIREDVALSFDTKFIHSMCSMIFTRGAKAEIDIYILLSELGKHAELCSCLAESILTYDEFEQSTEYLKQTSRLVILFSSLVKFIYPMIEQLDTLIDKNVEIISND